MCLWTSPQAKVKPTERGKVLGKLLFYILMILLVVLIFAFIGGAYTLGFFTLFLVLFGWCATRDPECYNIEQLLCVIFFSGYLWVTTLVDLILYLVKKDNPSLWALIGYFGGLIFFAASLYVAKQLYDELRINYIPAQLDPGTGMFGMPGGGGGIFGGGPRMPPGRPAAQYQQQQQQQGNVQGQGQIPPATRGFQAFQGEGHSLA